ncbi:MAG: macro domain-containing protein [Acholeplasmatales bacterium]
MILINDSIVSDKLLENADVVINPTNPYMIAGSGVSGLIFNKAGKEKLENYCKGKYFNPMKVGEVRVTKGFNIPCDILFVQGPKRYDYNTLKEAVDKLLLTYKNMLEFCLKNNYKNIVMPSLGTGIYGFKHEEVIEPVLKILTDDKYKTLEIKYVLYDEKVYDYYKKYILKNL